MKNKRKYERITIEIVDKNTAEAVDKSILAKKTGELDAVKSAIAEAVFEAEKEENLVYIKIKDFSATFDCRSITADEFLDKIADKLLFYGWKPSFQPKEFISW